MHESGPLGSWTSWKQSEGRQQSVAVTDYERVMGAPADGKLIRVIDCTNLDRSHEKHIQEENPGRKNSSGRLRREGILIVFLSKLFVLGSFIGSYGKNYPCPRHRSVRSWRGGSALSLAVVLASRVQPHAPGVLRLEEPGGMGESAAYLNLL